MKHLYAQLAPYLTDVSFQGLTNLCRCHKCTPKEWTCKELSNLKAFTSPRAKPLLARAIIHLERYWDKNCKNGPYLTHLDEEFVQLLAATPDLSYLNLTNVDIRTAAFAQLIGGRLKSMVIGNNPEPVGRVDRWMCHFTSLSADSSTTPISTTYLLPHLWRS